jgi:hypothetical protein
MPNPRLVIINAVRSKDQAEVFRCKVARIAFLGDHVAADPRTRARFAQLRRESKLDALVLAWSEELDAAAARVGLPHRSALQKHPAAYEALPLVTRHRFQEYDRLLTGLRSQTADDRAAAIIAFIGRELYPSPPPLVWWLGYGLMNYFDAETIAALWGEQAVNMELVVGTLDHVELDRGQQPDVAKLERYVDWYYRRCVASPRESIAALAREYSKQREADGVFTALDKKLVRDRIKEADRLLNGLVIPPEQVAALLRDSQTRA